MNLKKTLRCALAVTIALSGTLTARAQNKFTINGQLAPNVQGRIILSYKRHGEEQADTVAVTNGAFHFKNDVSDPCYSRLELNPPARLDQNTMKDYDYQSFFLEGTVLTITGDQKIKTAEIKGGKTQADLTELGNLYRPIEKKLNELYAQIGQYKKEMNDTAALRAQKQIQPLMAAQKKIDSVFIASRTDSYVAFELWRKKHRGIKDPDLEAGLKHFTSGIQNTEEGKKLANQIAFAKSMDVGKMAPNFTLNDTLGKPVTLSSFRGKNVMVFFYMTDIIGFDNLTFNMTRINRRLHDKNFVMIGVYYDNYINPHHNTLAYLKAITAQYPMSWITVTDFDGIGKDGAVSPVAKAYGLKSVNEDLPQGYLIGPDGKILARNLALFDKDVVQTIAPLLK